MKAVHKECFKRRMFLMISVIVIIMLASCLAYADTEDPYEGTCGNGVYWYVEDTNLSIWGEGAMDDYLYTSALKPWQHFASDIRQIRIGEGVTHIGSGAFTEMTKVSSVSIDNTVTSIGDDAFIGLSKLTKIDLPSGLTEIGDNCFAGTGLKSITIPGGVTKISECAFANCKDLAEVTIGDGVKIIGNQAFSYSSIKSVSIPDSVSEIEEYAFNGSKNLSSVDIGKGLKKIGLEAFVDCPALKRLKIPPNVTDIGNKAFGFTQDIESLEYSLLEGARIYGYSGTAAERYASESGLDFVALNVGDEIVWSLSDGVLKIRGLGPMTEEAESAPWLSDASSITSVVIEDGITSISEEAFSGCSNLESCEIPDTVMSIGNGAFKNCFKLASIAIPNTINSIGEYTFFSCTSLTEVSIPRSVKAIGTAAFSGCSNLTSVRIRPDLQSIGNAAFLACDSLKTITLSRTDVEIGDRAFGYVLMNGEDYFADPDFTIYGFRGSTAETYATSNGVIFEELEAHEFSDGLYWKLNSEGVLTISGNGTMDDYITEQATGNFEPPWYSDRDSIESILIEEGVQNIGSYAFNLYKNLSSVSIPGSVKSIGDYAFSGYNLKHNKIATITIPEGVESIGDYAFNYCSEMASIYLPSTLKKLGEGCFAYTSKLERLDLSGTKVKVIPTEFVYSSGVQYIFFPDDLKTIEGSAFNLSKLKELNIPESVTSVGGGICYKCTSLSKANLPSNLTSVPSGVFSNCQSLREFVIPENATSIGSYAFEKCYSLISVANIENISSIGEHAFDRCSRLNGLTLSDKLTEIDDYTFYGSGIEKISIPDGVTRIGEGAFGLTDKLVTLELPEGLKSLGYEAFRGSAIQIIGISTESGQGNELPAKLKEIPCGCFQSCDKLRSIIIPEEVTIINCSAFASCYNLDEVVFKGNKLETIDYDAFRFSGLLAFDMPDSVNEVGRAAFMDCEKMTEIELSDSLTTLTASICNNCDTLETVRLGSNTESISSSSFMLCPKLSTIYVPASLRYVSSDAFSGCDALYGEAGGNVYYDGIESEWITLKENNSGSREFFESVIHLRDIVDISHAKVTGIEDEYHYNGRAHTPEPVVNDGDTVLVKDKDYTVTYKNNTHGGTATITIKGIHYYKGSITVKFTITPIKMTPVVKLSKKSFVYNGKVQKPTVKATNTLGAEFSTADYTVSFDPGCKAIGTYTVKITMKRDYTGWNTKIFKINPPKVTGFKVTSPKANKIKVTFNKASGGVNYQIAYKLKSASKWTTKNVTGTSKTFDKFKGGKTYQVKVRAYKKVKGTTYYGAWTAIKSLKVKK
ncbi:MAG: fibronectin type III domain-containing protein [Clostridiales bacterium]|nr:fibronectin type III domain-containing protein [Clostridiales bacterium]